MSVNLSKDRYNQTLHWLSVTSFPAEVSIIRMVLVESGDEWVGYGYKHRTLSGVRKLT